VTVNLLKCAFGNLMTLCTSGLIMKPITDFTIKQIFVYRNFILLIKCTLLVHWIPYNRCSWYSAIKETEKQRTPIGRTTNSKELSLSEARNHNLKHEKGSTLAIFSRYK